MTHRKAIRASVVALVTAALIGVGIVGAVSSAQAATPIPNGSGGTIDPSTDVWYYGSNGGDLGTQYVTNETTTSGVPTSCFQSTAPAIQQGYGTSDGTVGIAATSLPVQDFTGTTPTANFDFSTLPCSTDWGLDGNWVLEGGDGNFTTGASGTMPVPISDMVIGNAAPANGQGTVYWLQRTGGSWISGQINPLFPSINGVEYDQTVALGGTLSFTPADLAAGCTVNYPGATCDPDASAITLPNGATQAPDGTITFTATTVGDFPIEYSVTDAALGLTENFTGTITVGGSNVIVGVPQTYNISVGDTVTLTADELSTGATNSSDGSAVGSDIVVFNTPLPAGATTNELDNGESLTFVATTPGTYHVSYFLSYLAKTPDTSDLITSTITVTSPAVHLPTVTG